MSHRCVVAEWWACLLLTISTATLSAQPSDSPEKPKDLKCSKFVSGNWGNVVCAAFGIIILGAVAGVKCSWDSALAWPPGCV
jgi:hypothetical protein